MELRILKLVKGWLKLGISSSRAFNNSATAIGILFILISEWMDGFIDNLFPSQSITVSTQLSSNLIAMNDRMSESILNFHIFSRSSVSFTLITKRRIFFTSPDSNPWLWSLKPALYPVVSVNRNLLLSAPFACTTYAGLYILARYSCIISWSRHISDLDYSHFCHELFVKSPPL